MCRTTPALSRASRSVPTPFHCSALCASAAHLPLLAPKGFALLRRGPEPPLRSRARLLSGKTITFKGIVIWLFANAKLVERWASVEPPR